MPFIKDFIEKEKVSRREFLLKSALGLGAFSVGAQTLLQPRRVFAADTDITIAWGYRDRSSPYWNAVVSGGEAFVKSLGRDVNSMTQLINNGSSEKSLSDVRALLAKTQGKLALAIDTNDAPNSRPVIESVYEAKAYASTIWNKADDLHPWDFGDHYVSHMSWSDIKPAEDSARLMFEKMGGKGKIVGLGGIASNNPAIERQQGLMNALKDYPDIELLDYQAADWDTQKANQTMSSFLTRYGTDIGGIFCANDTMAFGAVEALRAEGLVGIPVIGFDGTTQAVEMIMAGDMLATTFTNPYWGGGITASLAYHAAIGTFKPSEEPKEHREFYGPSIVISQDDAEAFKQKYIDATPDYDWEDFWGPSNGQIVYPS